MGYTDPDEKAIWISNSLTRHQIRCTIVHEIIHAVRGDTHDDPATEAIVRIETARRLIPIEALAGVLAWSTHPDDICEALEVDHGVLRDRLRNLTDDELGKVRRHLVRTVHNGPDPDPASGMCLLHQWWIRHRQPDPAPRYHNCALLTRGDDHGTGHRERDPFAGEEGAGRDERAA